MANLKESIIRKLEFALKFGLITVAQIKKPDYKAEMIKRGY